MLGSQVQKPMEILLPLERQVCASSSGDEMMTMRVCSDPVTGKELESRCSSDIANLDSGKAFSGFMSPGAEVTHGFGFRVSGFARDMVISSAMVGIEPPILKEVSPIPCRHPWVVLNRFSPLSNLGNWMEAEFGEGEAHEEDWSSPHHDTT